MDVMKHIFEQRRRSPLHFTLIDPDKQKPEMAAELAKKAMQAGSDSIMVGGTFGDTYGDRLNGTVKSIKKAGLPVILFPNSAQQLSPDADALFFMSLLNSRNTQYLIDEQMKGALIVHKFGLEPLPMAYLIIESGATTSAGWAGDVRPIPMDKPEFAVGYALAAKYFGMKFVYLEAGSGAKTTVPKEMVSAVKKAIGDDMMVIVGGGIRDPETAKEKIAAGADIIVTGTIAEDDLEKFKDIVKAIKS
jgi:phosphoglycerol geranylgeranyltransferase